MWEISYRTHSTSVYPRPMAHPQIADEVLRVTEPELQEKLSTWIDRVVGEQIRIVAEVSEALFARLRERAAQEDA